MAIKRVTMQDIADACNLSRNTVSKIFNDRGAVPEATRQMVIQKAEELGYMQFGIEKSGRTGPVEVAPVSTPHTNTSSAKTIALLIKRIPDDYHFGALLLPSLTEKLSRYGYTLTMHEVRDNDLTNKTLPKHLSLEQITGIITIEIFDKDYLDMLSRLNIPMIAVDAFFGAGISIINYDFISMENLASTITLTSHIISRGAKNIGFIGDQKHCNSFHERFVGFSLALQNNNLQLKKELCILKDDSEPYYDINWLISQIKAMPYMPDAFVCANDYLAINTIKALKQMNISIPDEILVAGFDGILQSEVIEPSLTTVKIPSKEIGKMAAEMLLTRIKSPEKPFRKMYVATTPVFRNSTL